MIEPLNDVLAKFFCQLDTSSHEDTQAAELLACLDAAGYSILPVNIIGNTHDITWWNNHLPADAQVSSAKIVTYDPVTKETISEEDVTARLQFTIGLTTAPVALPLESFSSLT